MLRALFLMLLALGCLLPAGGVAAQSASPDRRLLASASLRLAHDSPAHTSAWLRRQGAVRTALLGRDGRTLDVRFRDGLRAAILPASSGPPRLPARLFQPYGGARSVAHSAGGRALVLEPFATELDLGAHDADPIVSDLQAAGFAVDQAYDGAVTVDLMASLSHYNVVYMVAHVGVNPAGEAVVATGQQVDGDASVSSLMQDGSVMIVSVAGTSEQYYGILSTYIRVHEDSFPSHSLVVVNGCGLLRGTIFWQALAAKGVAAMVSWDSESMNRDESQSGAAFFASLAGGSSVDGAIQAVHAAGLGTSVVDGQPASFGYLGDGSLTLQSILPPALAPGQVSVPPLAVGPGPRLDVTVTAPQLMAGRAATLRIAVKDRASHNSIQGAYVVLDALPVGVTRTLRGMTGRRGAISFAGVRPASAGVVAVRVVKAGYPARKLKLTVLDPRA